MIGLPLRSCGSRLFRLSDSLPSHSVAWDHALTVHGNILFGGNNLDLGRIPINSAEVFRVLVTTCRSIGLILIALSTNARLVGRAFLVPG